MSEQTPQIALLGCGLWGRNIARNLAALDALYAVHDLNSDAAQNFADEFNANVNDDDDDSDLSTDDDFDDIGDDDDNDTDKGKTKKGSKTKGNN